MASLVGASGNVVYTIRVKDVFSFSNEELISSTRALVSEELRIGLEVLTHLREVERRKLHLERGHPSLFAFCLRELGYSEPQAQLRIDAMRALRDTPQIEEKVRSGELKVSSLVKVQQFLRREKARTGKATTAAERTELFSRVQGMSTREVERELIAISPQSAVPHERTRAVSAELSELRLVIPEGLRKRIEQVKALYSHRLKDVNSTAELLELMVSDVLKKEEVRSAKPDLNVAPAAPKVSVVHCERPQSRSRYIPSRVRAQVWKSGGGRCGFRDPKTGHVCGSRKFLQIDHKVPFSLGGSSVDPENLRLLCGAHNRLAWEKRA